MKDERLAELAEFQDRIGYSFGNVHLLNYALTHSSFANEKELSVQEYNERLEFLGDAVLEMIASEYLYYRFPHYSEGSLTKMRASAVRGQALAVYAQRIGLGRFLLLGKGEDATGGRKRPSILADAFEAVIGAIYLDGGYEKAKEFAIKHIKDGTIDIVNGDVHYDFKTCLQEKIQSETGKPIEYRLVRQTGPDHDKTFYVKVWIGNEIWGEGTGKSKKEAEQDAAREALDKLVK